MESAGKSSEAAESSTLYHSDHVSLSFESITFSDNTSLALDADDVVVFVGPNNAGKSAALRELQNILSQRSREKPEHTYVIKSCKVRRLGTDQALMKVVERASIRTGTPGQQHLQGYRFSLAANELAHHFNNDQRVLAPFFCLRVPTETRIIDSNPAPNISLLDQAPQHPINVLQANDEIEVKISEYFKKAFGQHLIVYHAGGNQVPLFVGRRPTIDRTEHYGKTSYLTKLRSNSVPLSEQGDGMRSFTSVLLSIHGLEYPSIILIDEPEAFLHPPQARLIGEFIANERIKSRQIFVATHSTDVVRGIIAGSTDKVRILRIVREGITNKIMELDKEKMQEISKDPLARFSPIFDGMFHRHVVICEADADCLFYNSMLSAILNDSDQRPDILFLHAGGKDRVGKLCRALIALGVPVSVICDLDVINADQPFRGIVETLGGAWSMVEPDWRSLKTAVEQSKPPLSITELKGKIDRIFAELDQKSEFPKNKRRKVMDLLRDASSWSYIKKGGVANIPSGQAQRNFAAISEICERIGLFVVPVGQLEGFCRTVEGSHGAGWVQAVIERGGLRDDPELEAARKFVGKILSRINSIC